MKLTMSGDEDEADQQPDGTDVGRLEPVAELDGGHLGHVGVVEVRDELRDQQEEEQQARKAGPRFRDRREHLVARP